MGREKSSARIIAISALAIVINVVVGRTVSMLSIPFLFLDTMGTIFVAANFGMGWGILTGFTTNALAAVLGGGAIEIPFSLVSVTVAIIVALVARNSVFTFKRALIAGIILGFVTPMVGTIIRLTLFGGFTGSGTDILIFALRSTGQSMFSSTYFATLLSNMVDKIASCLLVAWFSQQAAIRRSLAL